MYRVKKRMEVAGSHSLSLPYASPCSRLHGHNWIIEVELCGHELNAEGMLMDFGQIKSIVHGQLDHRNINEVMEGNPTAERIAAWIADKLQTECFQHNPIVYVDQVTVQESEGNVAVWER